MRIRVSPTGCTYVRCGRALEREDCMIKREVSGPPNIFFPPPVCARFIANVKRGITCCAAIRAWCGFFLIVKIHVFFIAHVAMARKCTIRFLFAPFREKKFMSENVSSGARSFVIYGYKGLSIFLTSLKAEFCDMYEPI